MENEEGNNSSSCKLVTPLGFDVFVSIKPHEKWPFVCFYLTNE